MHRPLKRLTPQEARKQPSPTTAVMDVMKENNIPMPPPAVDTVGKENPGGWWKYSCPHLYTKVRNCQHAPDWFTIMVADG